MLDDIIKHVSNKDYSSFLSSLKSSRFDSLDVVNKLIYTGELSNLKWLYQQFCLNNVIKI